MAKEFPTNVECVDPILRVENLSVSLQIAEGNRSAEAGETPPAAGVP